MLVTVDENVTNAHLFWYYLSSVSGFLTIIINSILLIHVIYHYTLRARHDENEKQKQIKPDKPLHYLTCSYFICGILSSICFGLIRSNIFTSYSYNYSIFSSTSSISNSIAVQCAIGYFGSYIFSIFAKVVLYYLLLRRIQIVFRNSCYDYADNFYHVLYKLLVPVAPFIIISLIFIGKLWHPTNIEWILHYHEPTGLLYCGSTGDFNGWIIAAFVFGLMYDFCLTTTLVFAFLKSLYSLQMDTLEQHLAEANTIANQENQGNIINHQSEKENVAEQTSEPQSPNSPDSTIGVISTTTETAQTTEIPAITPSISPRVSSKIFHLGVFNDNKHENKKPSMTLSSSIDEVMEEYDQSTRSQKDRIKRLIILLKLSKKQTILACIAILSTLLFVILSLISSKISLQMCLDILINSICVWLMNGAANKQWNFVTKYCCCYICYWKIHTITRKTRNKSIWE